MGSARRSRETYRSAPSKGIRTIFFRTAELNDNSDRVLTRLDWRPGANDSVFGRYIHSNRDRQIPGAFGGVVDGTGTSAFGNQQVDTDAVVGGWTRVLSNPMVNEARVSWSRARADAVHQAFGLTPPASFNLFNKTNFGLPNKDISSRATFGTITSLSGDPRTMQLSLRFLF
jgi:hypothetical protein